MKRVNIVGSVSSMSTMKTPFFIIKIFQGFSYLSEVGARGLLNLGKKHLDHRNWENLMQSIRTEQPSKMD